jgi:iron(III) transport system substrate-binding protein
VTALRVLEGEDAARDWLTAFAANDAVAFESNDLVLQAVNDGQIAMGLINHYYRYALAADIGEDAVSAELHYVTGEDPAGLVNVAGVGVLAQSDASEAALAAAEFLLSEEAQQYFADETAEYPVVDGVTSTVHELPPLDSLQGPDIDLSELASLEETLALLQEVGLS